MKIIELNVTRNFRYLWLKSVVGVDLSQHCARSLVGQYNNNISNSIKHLENLEISNEVHYLCGVAFPFNWNNNFHLAFRYCEGNILEYSSNGVSIKIQDAEMLPISPEYIDDSDPHSRIKSYCTCRNWQFAHYFAKHLT